MTCGAFLSELLPAFVLLGEVLIDGRSMGQVEGDRSANLFQTQRGKVGSDGLREPTVPVGVNDGIEGNARAGDPPATLRGLGDVFTGVSGIGPTSLANDFRSTSLYHDSMTSSLRWRRSPDV